MESLDVFESVFKRAQREPFEYREIPRGKTLLVTDLEGEALSRYEARVRAFLSEAGDGKEWVTLARGDFRGLAELEARVRSEKPSLIAAYRLVRESREAAKFSLGAYLDTLTQVVPVPVLVLPSPEATLREGVLENRDSVMVVTDHLSGAHALVNHAVALTQPEGSLVLCHLEDEPGFERIMEAISKIPEIETNLAREKLREQLLAGPRQYIESVSVVLKKRRPKLRVRSVVEMGPVVDRYRALLAEQRTDLLVFGSKDDGQLAMHSLGHSLAVEFRGTPLLLL